MAQAEMNEELGAVGTGKKEFLKKAENFYLAECVCVQSFGYGGYEPRSDF